MNGAERGTAVLAVCISCRTPGSEADRPGETLLAELRARTSGSDPGLAIRAVQCLSVCKRPCTVSLSGPGRYTYVFGDLDPVSGAAELLACAETFRRQGHGYMLWRERPESLRRGIVARVPPAEWDRDDGSHPR